MSRKFPNFDTKMFKVTSLTTNTSPSASPTSSPSPKPSPSPQMEDSPVPAPILPSIESASQAEQSQTTTPLQSPKLIKFQLETKTSAKTTEMKNSVEVQGPADAAVDLSKKAKENENDEKQSDDKGEPIAGPSVTDNGAIIQSNRIEHAERLKPETEESNEDGNKSVDKGEPIAGTSGINKGATQPPIRSGEGHQPEAGESKKVAEIKKFVEQQRTSSSANCSCSSTSKTSYSLTAEDITQMLARMGCLECHKIPSPFRLFQCPRGHLFCFDCGMKRFTKEDEGQISSGTCDHEIEKEGKGSKSKSARGIGYGLINPDLKLAAGEIEKPVKNKKTGKYECRLRVRPSMGDPVYKAMYNNTLWNCPYMRYGCQAKVYGKDIHEHMLPCMKKLGIL